MAKGEDPPSNVKPGRFSGEGGRKKGPLKKPELTLADVDGYTYSCSYIEGLVVLTEPDNPYTEFTMAIRLLMKEGQKVDPCLVFCLVDEGSNKDCLVVSPNQVPINQTDLLAIVNCLGMPALKNANPGERRRKK